MFCEYCDSDYIKDFEIIVFDHDMLFREIQISLKQERKTFIRSEAVTMSRMI